jgi:hypothetical protein
MGTITNWDAGSGNWDDENNWDDGIPAAGDTANIDISATVTLSTATALDEIYMDATGAHIVETASGSITADTLNIQEGQVVLGGTNSIGSVLMEDGTKLSFGSSSALNTGGITDFGGDLIATASFVLNGPVTLGDYCGIGATVDQTFELTGDITLGFGLSALSIGGAHEKGDVVLAPSSLINNSNEYAFLFSGGEVKLGTAAAAAMINDATNVVMPTSAFLDLGGQNVQFTSLSDGGYITNSGGPATVTFSFGQFNGSIQQVTGHEITLDLDNSVGIYTPQTVGKTFIQSGAILTLGDKGAIDGAISDSGTLYIQDPELVLSHAIAGTGGLEIDTDKLTIDAINTYKGPTTLVAGTVALNAANPFGTGILTVATGTLLDSATSETLHNPVDLLGGSFLTIEGQSGHSITFDGNFSGSASSLIFESLKGNGECFLNDRFSASIAHTTVNQGMDVVLGGSRAGSLFSNSQSTSINGTVNGDGHSATFYNLTGTGTITSNVKGAVMTFDSEQSDGSFTGTLSGYMNVKCDGYDALDSNNLFHGAFDLGTKATLELDTSVDQAVDFAGKRGDLAIDTSTFGGTIDGFTTGDTIDVKDLTFSDQLQYNFNLGTLTVQNGAFSETLKFGGNYTTDNFKILSDNSGGSFIHFVSTNNMPPHAPSDALAQAQAEHAANWLDAHTVDTTGLG